MNAPVTNPVAPNTEALTLVKEKDYGTPERQSEKLVTLEVDGITVSVPQGTSVMRAAAEIGFAIPRLCATDSLEAFGSCRLCLVEIEGRRGDARFLHHAGRARHEGEDPDPEARQAPPQRDGALYLRSPAGLLDLCSQRRLRAAGHGGRGGPARGCATAMTARTISAPPRMKATPISPSIPRSASSARAAWRACEEVQGTFALTIGGRGFGSHVSAGQDEDFLSSECVSCGACVQACPTATLMDKSVIEKGQPEHSVVTTCAYCGVGCSFKAEMRGTEVVRMMPLQGWRREPWPFLREGPLRLGLRDPQGPHYQADDPRQDHRSLAGSLLGRGDQPRRFRVQADPAAIRPRLDRRNHLVSLHQRRDLSGSEDGPCGVRQQQCRYLRPGLPFADRLRSRHHARYFRRHPDL